MREDYRLKLLLLIGSVLLTLLCGEAILRIAGVSYPSFGGKRQFFTWDPYTGVALRPGAEGMMATEGAENFARISSQGLRDREHERQKPPNTFRIAVLGDSFAEAFQVPVEKTFWAVLERDLSACPSLNGNRVETINFGVSGYGTAQELQMLRHRVWAYSPDVVLLAFFTGNDIQDNSRILAKDPYRPYFVHKDGNLVIDDSFQNAPGFRSQYNPLRMSLSWALSHSRLLQIMAAARSYVSQRNVDGVKSTEMGLEDAIYRDPIDPAWREAWLVTEDLITMMRDEVTARGVQFFIVTLTNSVQVDPDLALRQELMGRLGVKNLFYPDYRIHELGERKRIPVLTLAPAFLKYAEEHKVTLHGLRGNHQGHWNQEGHRLAGEMIAQELCADGLASSEHAPVSTNRELNRQNSHWVTLQ